MSEPRDAADQAFDIAMCAMGHAPAAMAELASLATAAKSEAARIAAIKEILALACGKAATAATDDGPLEVRFVDHWGARDGSAE